MRCINYRSIVGAFEHRRRDIYWKIIGAALAIGKAHELNRIKHGHCLERRLAESLPRITEIPKKLLTQLVA